MILNCSLSHIPALGVRTLVAAAIASAPGIALSQGTIHGTVRDSLRNGAVIGSAVVELVGSSEQTIADSAGQFEFRDVKPGNHTLVYSGKRLDSLGLSSVMTNVNVTNGVVVNALLSTPSERTYKTAICGAAFDSTYGVLRGRAMRSAQEGLSAAKVSVQWGETLLMSGLVDERDRTIEATANSRGEYVFCGVPKGVEIILRVAEKASADTARVTFRLTEAVGVHDIVYAPRSQRVSVRGRVVSAAGASISGVKAIDRVTGAEYARSDSAGHFQFFIPAVSREIAFSATGLTARAREVNPLAAEWDFGDVFMAAISTAVAEQRALVSDDQEYLEFETRRKLGKGLFADLSNETGSKQSVLFSLPRSKIANVRSSYVIATQEYRYTVVIGRRECDPSYYVGHKYEGILSEEDQTNYISLARRVEVYEAANAPPEFSDPRHCGSVVLWLR